MSDVVEIKHTKFDENIWIWVPGERGAKYVFLGNIYMPPESTRSVKYIQRKFGEIAVHVQKYTRPGKVVLVVDFDLKSRESKQPE